MKRRQVLAGMAAMGVVGPLNLSKFLCAQSSEPQTSEPESSWPPPCVAHSYDPETQRELLGPVKKYIEEMIPQGMVTTREYGPDRKLLALRMERDGKIVLDSADNSADDPSSETRDAQGRMLSYRTRGDGGMRETSYNYDETGTLRSITNDQTSDRTEYREVNGVKMSIQTFDPKTLERFQNSGLGGSSWESAMSGFGVPMGGSVITTYDEGVELDCGRCGKKHSVQNPIEIRILTADGQIVSQYVRKYDASGRLVEEKTLQQNDGLLFLDRMTPEQKAAVTPEGAQAYAKELNEMRGKLPPETKYKYDAKGRLIEKRERTRFVEQTTTIEYNDRGDIERKRETFTNNSVNIKGNWVPEDSETRYSYQYDSFNNWTERVKSVDIGSNSMTWTTRRTITYY